MLDLSPLHEIQEGLTFTDDGPQEVDIPAEYRLYGEIIPTSLDVLSESTCHKLASIFSGAVKLQFPNHELAHPLITPDGLGDDISRLINQLKKSSAPLDIELSIKKQPLEKLLGIDDPFFASKIFFQRDQFIRNLTRPLHKIDGDLFDSQEQRVLFVVLDGDVQISGPVTTIVGQRQLEEVRSNWTEPDSRMKNRLREYQNARNHLNWAGFQLNHVTPLHMMGSPPNSETDGATSDICGGLCRHLLDLIIIYTANKSTRADDSFQATFKSPERKTEIEFDSSRQTDVPVQPLIRLARWPFDGGPVDRLAIFRNVVARSLRSKDPEANYKGFTERIDGLLSEAQWHHQIFLDEKIEQHFDRVQAASEYITSVIREISQGIDTLTQGLTNALLGAIGVIVLTLLTALAQEDLSEPILRLGMWAYAVYLILFPGAYRLLSIWCSQSLLESEVNQQREQFHRQLGREKVDAMMKPIEKRKAAFRFWLGLTAFLFLVVAVVIVIGGSQLPNYLIGN